MGVVLLTYRAHLFQWIRNKSGTLTPSNYNISRALKSSDSKYGLNARSNRQTQRSPVWRILRHFRALSTQRRIGGWRGGGLVIGVPGKARSQRRRSERYRIYRVVLIPPLVRPAGDWGGEKEIAAVIAVEVAEAQVGRRSSIIQTACIPFPLCNPAQRGGQKGGNRSKIHPCPQPPKRPGAPRN